MVSTFFRLTNFPDFSPSLPVFFTVFHIVKFFFITARVCGKVMFSYCLCVCLSVCVSVWAITFECLDIESSFSVWWNILTISRSSLSIKSHWVKVMVILINGHFGLLGTKFFCYDQFMVLIKASRSRTSQDHHKVTIILRWRTFQNQIVSVWISIPKWVVGFRPNAFLFKVLYNICMVFALTVTGWQIFNDLFQYFVQFLLPECARR